VNVDDLLVGTDRRRMASLAVEPDGSVMMSVVPKSVSAICPVCGTLSGRRHTWFDILHWTCPGASSPCDCPSGRGASSATNPSARECLMSHVIHRDD
jgi:hypothetical protein